MNFRTKLKVEHAAAKNLIAQIKNMSSDDDIYDAKVKRPGEQIDHHVKDDEGELFPKRKSLRWTWRRWAFACLRARTS